MRLIHFKLGIYCKPYSCILDNGQTSFFRHQVRESVQTTKY